MALQAAAYTTALQSGLVTTPPQGVPWYDEDTQQITLDSKEQIQGFNTWVNQGAGDSSELKTQFNVLGNDIDDYWYDNAASGVDTARNASTFKEQYGIK